MGKYGETIVEMHKIINNNPFESLWLYWETDIYYTIIGSIDQIMVRTSDKVLTNSEATFIGIPDTEPLPIGTYSIGTISDEYVLTVGTVGYVSDVHYNGNLVGDFSQIKIPNDFSVEIEWETTIDYLYPFINPIRSGGYGVGATYSLLTRRVVSQDL
jgi:hypothetical protein